MTEPIKNDPDLLNSGTGAGLLYFFDIMIKRSEVNASTGGALRTASKKYLELEEDPDSVKLREIDVDNMSRRFVNKNRVELNEKSLETYAHRFQKAVEMYLNFLDGKDWNTIKTRSTPKSAAKGGNNGGKTSPKTQPPKGEGQGASVPPPPLAVGMTEFPIPLRPGVVGKLVLPNDLTAKEAKRVVTIVSALAIEEQLALPAGAESSSS